jgi:HSP20 family protein
MYIKPYRGRRYRIQHAQKPITRDVHVPLNVKVKEDEYVVEMIVPGLSPEDLDIEVIENKIDIQGEFTKPEEDVTYLRQEIPAGKFRRVITLPKMLAVDESEASLEQGVLSLRVLVAEEALPRTIKVKTS